MTSVARASAMQPDVADAIHSGDAIDLRRGVAGLLDSLARWPVFAWRQ